MPKRPPSRPPSYPGAEARAVLAVWELRGRTDAAQLLRMTDEGERLWRWFSGLYAQAMFENTDEARAIKRDWAPLMAALREFAEKDPPRFP